MNEYILSDMRVGEEASIFEIGVCDLQRRFFDLGMIPGTRVKCVCQSPGNDMKAYVIRGAVIAIRNSDCGSIRISRGSV